MNWSENSAYQTPMTTKNGKGWQVMSGTRRKLGKTHGDDIEKKNHLHVWVMKDFYSRKRIDQ